MPAMLDDPATPTFHRVSGKAPFPDPANPVLPAGVRPRQVTLRDRHTVATLVPFASRDQVPPSLLQYLADQFAKEVEAGDSYPMLDPLSTEQFSTLWFQNFGAVMLLGSVSSADEIVEGKDWSKECLGSFYIKPNYPGRSSHVANAGFLVTDAARNRGVGRLMGEGYIDWAPRLGYTYSVFNLVYETNVASCRIWDALGFKRIGRVKGCGNLKSYPDRLIDAIIYGRDLVIAEADGTDAQAPVSDERFDKIKFFLKYGRYPDGSDRAEKSRLRSAATHYKLLDNDVLMLKGKEVVSDPVRQLEIARVTHENGSHAGINKTTATIAEKYHWSRIKETVSDAIRICAECKDQSRTPTQQPAPLRRGMADFNPATVNHASIVSPSSETHQMVADDIEAASRMLSLATNAELTTLSDSSHHYNPNDISSILNPVHPVPTSPEAGLNVDSPMFPEEQTHAHHIHHANGATLPSLHDHDQGLLYQPIDPQIISQSHHHQQPHDHFDTFQPHHVSAHSSPHQHHGTLPGHLQPQHHPQSRDAVSFQALLNASVEISRAQTEQNKGPELHDHAQQPPDQDQDAVDRDLDLLIDQDDYEMEDMIADESASPAEDAKDEAGKDVTMPKG